MCEDRINELACVVVDELHMVQDSSRGGTLELALTKLLFAARKAVEGHYSTANARGDGEETHDHLVPLTEPSGFTGDFGDASADDADAAPDMADHHDVIESSQAFKILSPSLLDPGRHFSAHGNEVYAHGRKVHIFSC